MESFTDREAIVEIVNKLFVYTDYQRWDDLQKEVFTEELLFDMSSLGGEKAMLTSKHICETWKAGFAGLDGVNHLSGNYILDINNSSADVFAYATATHYKKSAVHGNTREFIGSYQLHLTKKVSGWRIDQFKYDLKFMKGNIDLK
ncbi:MAG TPA: nuclear transport factor 2 family protein [Puia sp.]|nr:nuclear transport factor 2 family protein [Puia sp.]